MACNLGSAMSRQHVVGGFLSGIFGTSLVAWAVPSSTRRCQLGQWHFGKAVGSLISGIFDTPLSLLLRSDRYCPNCCCPDLRQHVLCWHLLWHRPGQCQDHTRYIVSLSKCSSWVTMALTHPYSLCLAVFAQLLSLFRQLIIPFTFRSALLAETNLHSL